LEAPAYHPREVGIRISGSNALFVVNLLAPGETFAQGQTLVTNTNNTTLISDFTNVMNTEAVAE